jgi:hypothetical protein
MAVPALALDVVACGEVMNFFSLLDSVVVVVVVVTGVKGSVDSSSWFLLFSIIVNSKKMRLYTFNGTVYGIKMYSV